MPTMGKYCKAFPVKRVQEWPEWNNKVKQSPNSAGHVFIHENYTVTGGIFLDQDIFLSDATPEWKEFCNTVLGFRTGLTQT
jgi:hypothetical protein